MTLDSTAGSSSPASPASPAAAASAPVAGLALPRRSIGQLVAISIFWFALNFHWIVLPSFIVPSQVIGLLFQLAPAGTLASRADWANSHAGLTQAVVSAPGLIVALFTNPYFGLLSDRTRGRFGRRRPYILGGTLGNVVGLAVMALAPALLLAPGSGNTLAPSVLVLMFGLMLVQFSNNAAAAPFHALLPDMVPAEQRGLASGIMGLAYWCGTISGSILPLFFGFDSKKLLGGTQDYVVYQRGIMLTYGVVMAVIVVLALLTILLVHEMPWRADMLSAELRSGERHTSRDLIQGVLAVVIVVAAALLLLHVGIAGLRVDDGTISVLQLIAVIIAGLGAARAFDFRPRRNPDFTWVVFTRMLVMMGIYIVQNFLLLYMLNVAKADSPQEATTIFLIILTLAATASTAFAGWASDRVGRKRMVYISGTFMALVGAAFVLAPYLVPGNILILVYGAGAIFGLGFGAYISVDWALVADVLPSEATFARDMGVWNIGLTLPQVFALVFGGWLLALGIALGNPSIGYTLLFVWLAIFCALGTVTVRYIRGVKR